LIEPAPSAPAPGDLAEIGVWHGTTFMPMAEIGRHYGRTVHAVDSFQGMAQPTDRDTAQYPKGALSVGGSEIFRELVAPYGNVVVHEGVVPEVLDRISVKCFAFVHLDLDHYAPTRAALEWLWPRMSPGGILCCHDWTRERTTLAAGAINDWARHSGVPISGVMERSAHCWFVRPFA